jgi:hypothetical protein
LVLASVKHALHAGHPLQACNGSRYLFSGVYSVYNQKSAIV